MYRIVLVDDEALIREGVSENVKWEKYGYEFAGSFENGREALAFIEGNPVDVVLTDICMPYMDGMELSGELSRNYPSVKIIILSGYDDFEYAKKALHYGVKDYLLKPITAKELGEVLLRLKEEMDREHEDKQKVSEMKQTYRRGKMLLYSDALFNLITGRKTESESRKELEEVNLTLNAGLYRVAVLRLDVYEKADRLDEKQKRESALMAFVLYNIAQEIVNDNEAGVVCQGKDRGSFILFTAENKEESRELIEQICSEIVRQMNNMMQLAVNVGIGSYVTEMKDIYMSYDEALKVMEYRYVLGTNRIMEFEKILSGKSPADTDSILEAMELHMKEGSAWKLSGDFDVLKSELRSHAYDSQQARTVLQRIVYMLKEICRKSDLEAGMEHEKSKEILSQVLSAWELEEAVRLLSDYCIEVSDELDSRRNVGGKKYAVMAMDYIERNYSDCNLGLQSVCSFLNISTSRFSTIFKAATGNTFVDVLIGIRMKKAKELLEHTDLKNYEIAEKVGFNDPHYFSIAFKRITGKTPTEYAREMRK